MKNILKKLITNFSKDRNNFPTLPPGWTGAKILIMPNLPTNFLNSVEEDPWLEYLQLADLWEHASYIQYYLLFSP